MGETVATGGTTSQESVFLDFVQRLERHRDERSGVHLHLSRLKPQNRRDHHLRIAINTLEDFLRAYEGQIFTMGNADLVFVCKGTSMQELDEIVMRMRYLFSDDPLTNSASGEGGHGQFATLYNVANQYSRFLELAKKLYADEIARKKRLQKLAQQSGEGVTQEVRRPLSPQQLGRLEEILERSDLSAVFRRQAVCVIGKDEDVPKPMFRELFISIMDLAKTVLPDVDLIANRWLFQHLTQTLDKRVLKLLTRADDSSLHSSFSVNLNVNTLLSKEFLDFDDSLRMGSRGTLVVELQLIDILSDFNNFIFARDFAREKGYRVCLDGVTSELLPFIDRHGLGVDLVKLAASPVFDSVDDDGGRLEDIAAKVQKVGKGRVILARVDNEMMISNGQAMGITMFQGRHIDQTLQRLSRANRGAPAPKTRRLAR